MAVPPTDRQLDGTAAIPPLFVPSASCLGHVSSRKRSDELLCVIAAQLPADGFSRKFNRPIYLVSNLIRILKAPRGQSISYLIPTLITFLARSRRVAVSPQERSKAD